MSESEEQRFGNLSFLQVRHRPEFTTHARLGWLVVISGLLLIFFGGCSDGDSAQNEPAQASLVVVPYDGVTIPDAAPEEGALASVTTAAWPAPDGEPSAISAAYPAATETAVLPPTPTLRPTLTPSPTPTSTPTVTPTDTPTATPTITPTATPLPVLVNGIPSGEIIVMSPAVRQKVRETLDLGNQLGRNPHAFSKIGDSVALTPHYLTFFDKERYVLGEYDYLQPAINHYAGSFERYGVATRIGLHAWSLFDPLWADKEWCSPNEDMVACEIRLHNPSVLLVRLGSNDAGAEKAFNDNMRALVEYALENGIVPILGTKADRFEGLDDRNNKIIREIAADYDLPLWDFDLIAGTIPQRGLGGDQVHMTMTDNNDYSDPNSFTRGYPVSDLTALMALYEIYEEVAIPGDA